MSKAILLTCLLGTAALSPAQVLEPEAPSHMSDSVRSMVTGRLPAYNPAVHRAPPRAELTPEPGVILMPRMEVRERKAPKIDPDDMLSRDALRSRARAAYRDELMRDGDLNYWLNSWSIPIFSPSFTQRAAAAYGSNRLNDQLSRLDSVIKAVGRTDPDGAAKLRQEVTNMVTGRHPSGN